MEVLTERVGAKLKLCWLDPDPFPFKLLSTSGSALSGGSTLSMPDPAFGVGLLVARKTAEAIACDGVTVVEGSFAALAEISSIPGSTLPFSERVCAGAMLTSPACMFPGGDVIAVAVCFEKCRRPGCVLSGLSTAALCSSKTLMGFMTDRSGILGTVLPCPAVLTEEPCSGQLGSVLEVKRCAGGRTEAGDGIWLSN